MAAHCDEIGTELVAYLDGELPDGERRPIATHLSTCLVCRREVERLTTVRRWIGELPTVEPSADFARDFWRRLEAEPGARGGTSRWWWAAPALAAAAVLVLAVRSLMPSAVDTTPAAHPVVAQAPVAKPAPQVAAKPHEENAPALADAGKERAPEDLPPELLEHPELFLRLPVVQRLETLEHFDEVRQQGDAEGGRG